MYLVIDLEATCKQDVSFREKMETIEIGAVALNDRGKVLGEFQTFIRPQVEPQLSDFCKELTSITQEQVDNALYFWDAIFAFKIWVAQMFGGETPIMVSWGKYDVTQLKRDYARWKGKLIHNGQSIFDDAFFFKKHINIKQKYLRTFSHSSKNGYLETATKYLGIPWEGRAHRGIDDTRMIVKVMQKMVFDLNYQITDKDIEDV